MAYPLCSHSTDSRCCMYVQQNSTVILIEAIVVGVACRVVVVFHFLLLRTMMSPTMMGRKLEPTDVWSIHARISSIVVNLVQLLRVVDE